MGTNPPATLADPRLTYTNGTLTYTPATNQFLGTNGQTVTATLASRRGNSFQPGGRGSLPRAPYGWLEVGDPSGLDNCAACSRCPASKFGASRDNRPVRQCLRKGG